MTDTPAPVNETTPNATPGGVIESVKRATSLALREALLGSTLEDKTARVQSIRLEYPLAPEHYPGIWVGFSVTELKRSGIAMERMHKNTSNPDWVNWEPYRDWFVKGRVTLTIAALSNLERDRISDSIISLLAFSRPPAGVITDSSRDIQEYRSLVTALAEDPYFSIGINSDEIFSGGESLTQAPWSPPGTPIPVYENLFSFDILGQFSYVYLNDGTYTIKRIETVPEVYDIHDWH